LRASKGERNSEERSGMCIGIVVNDEEGVGRWDSDPFAEDIRRRPKVAEVQLKL
jgi:hypothetical protein